MRAYVINRQVDDLRGTLYRQTMFAEFEKAIHAAEEAGQPLTLEGFRKIYRGLLDAYFGPEFSIDAELEFECLRIPHFYSAFYVYKYATGISAAVALASQVLETGNPSRYLSFLRSGASRFPNRDACRGWGGHEFSGPRSSRPRPLQVPRANWKNCSPKRRSTQRATRSDAKYSMGADPKVWRVRSPGDLSVEMAEISAGDVRRAVEIFKAGVPRRRASLEAGKAERAVSPG